MEQYLIKSQQMLGTRPISPQLVTESLVQPQHATTADNRTTMTSTPNPQPPPNQSTLGSPPGRFDPGGTSGLLQSAAQGQVVVAPHAGYSQAQQVPFARMLPPSAAFQAPREWHQQPAYGGTYDDGPTFALPGATTASGFDYVTAAGNRSFLGADYANISPLSAASLASSPRPASSDFSSPWHQPPGNSSATLVHNAAAGTKKKPNIPQPRGKGALNRDMDANELSRPADNDNLMDDGATSPKRLRKGKRPADIEVESSSGADADLDRPASSKPSRTYPEAASGDSTSSPSKSQSPTKLRSASRSSKNSLSKPSETPEERRSRASHNLVEKQYRNRLNAEFEGLLHALPEQVRATAGTAAPPSAEDEPDSQKQPPDSPGDRRVSKAEVLDMARSHILGLEREREALERKQNALLRDLERMEGEAGLVGVDGLKRDGSGLVVDWQRDGDGVKEEPTGE